MRNTILSLLVACGLLLVSPVADAEAQSKGVDGECQSVVSGLLGAINQIDQGIDVVNNCISVVGPGFGKFFGLGCGEKRIAANAILENGASCNSVATVCDVVFTCFNEEPPGCVGVDECTIP